MAENENELIKFSWALHRMVFSSSNTSRAYDFNRRKHSKFLKEIFHPYRNLDLKYKKRLSDIVSKHWEDNELRKKSISTVFTKSHTERKKNDPLKYYETQRKSAILANKKAVEAIQEIGIKGEIRVCVSARY
jgi:hypothetical protein